MVKYSFYISFCILSQRDNAFLPEDFGQNIEIHCPISSSRSLSDKSLHLDYRKKRCTPCTLEETLYMIPFGFSLISS